MKIIAVNQRYIKLLFINLLNEIQTGKTATYYNNVFLFIHSVIYL